MKLIVLPFLLLAGVYLAWRLAPPTARTAVKAITRRFFWPLAAIFLAVLFLAVAVFNGFSLQLL